MNTSGHFGRFSSSNAKREYAREAFARIRKALQMADSLKLLEDIHRVNTTDLATIREVSPDKGFAELMRITDERRSALGLKK